MASQMLLDSLILTLFSTTCWALLPFLRFRMALFLLTRLSIITLAPFLGLHLRKSVAVSHLLSLCCQLSVSDCTFMHVCKVSLATVGSRSLTEGAVKWR